MAENETEVSQNPETTQKEGLGNKIKKTNKRFLDSSEKTQGIVGRELNPEEKGKIKSLAVEFWNNFGKDHQDDVGSWANHDKGQKLIKHFVSDGKNADLYSNCNEYRYCFDAYQKEKGDTNYNYDESSVDFNRLQTDYDVAFYIVLSGLPRFFISSINQHTMGYVMTRFNEGVSISSIVKEARMKVNPLTANSEKDGKEGSEKEENKNESTSDEQTQEQKTSEQALKEKKEQDDWAVLVTKENNMKNIYIKASNGYYGDEVKQLCESIEKKHSELGNRDEKLILEEFGQRISEMARNKEISFNKIGSSPKKENPTNDVLDSSPKKENDDLGIGLGDE